MSNPAATITDRQCRFCLATPQSLEAEGQRYMAHDVQMFNMIVFPTGDCCIRCLMQLGRLEFAERQHKARQTQARTAAIHSTIPPTPKEPEAHTHCMICSDLISNITAEMRAASQKVMRVTLPVELQAEPGLCYPCCLELGEERWKETKRHFAAAVALAQDMTRIFAPPPTTTK